MSLCIIKIKIIMKQYFLILLIIVALVPNNLDLGLSALKVGKERVHAIAEKIPAFHYGREE